MRAGEKIGDGICVCRTDKGSGQLADWLLGLIICWDWRLICQNNVAVWILCYPPCCQEGIDL